MNSKRVANHVFNMELFFQFFFFFPPASTVVIPTPSSPFRRDSFIVSLSYTFPSLTLSSYHIRSFIFKEKIFGTRNFLLLFRVYVGLYSVYPWGLDRHKTLGTGMSWTHDLSD